MDWLVLIASGVMESVWATALSRSEGFTKLGPSIVFVLGTLISMAGLAYAMRSLPVGTAYAVWVGVGATLTVIIGIATGAEPFSAAKAIFIGGLVVCIIGLKLVSSTH